MWTKDGRLDDVEYLNNKYDFDCYVVKENGRFVESLDKLEFVKEYDDGFYCVYQKKKP